MAFERLRTSQQTDQFLGKPVGRGDAPWVPATPKQNQRSEIRRKAEQVIAGQAKFTRDEIHTLLAEFILSNG